jgi:16S rRNA (cytosine1402-N4)-methyltransferase
VSEAYHRPVLVDAVTAALGPALRRRAQDAVLVDCTCGGGGHTAALAHAAPLARVIVLDRDPEALAHAMGSSLRGLPRVDAMHAPFSAFSTVLDDLGITEVDAVLADLGVSSHQLDEGRRGFSFRFDAPLDMRMDTTRGVTAAEWLASTDVAGLTRVLRELGEEPEAGRVARTIVEAKPTTTGALAAVVERAVSPKRRVGPGRRIHPATLTFQALRMVVNDELGELEALLRDAPSWLTGGGRLGIITFHSLEDRMVKRRFRELTQPAPVPRGLPIGEHERSKPSFTEPSDARGGVIAGDTEQHDNPRSRSARLRILERR